MVFLNMDGWRRLGSDNALLDLYGAHAGWRKRTPGGDGIYVFEHCMSGRPYHKRFSMVMFLHSAPAESRISVDLPQGREGQVLAAVFELLDSTGVLLNMALKGIMPKEVCHD
jgi:hypothetical protein